MIHEYQTNLPGSDVLRRAKTFFAESIPLSAAYPEKEGPTFLVLRGQGGEEIAMSVAESPEGTRIRASTLLFDQAINRFFSTLPMAREVVS
jgi:hypothetical protein